MRTIQETMFINIEEEIVGCIYLILLLIATILLKISLLQNLIQYKHSVINS